MAARTTAENTRLKLANRVAMLTEQERKSALQLQRTQADKSAAERDLSETRSELARAVSELHRDLGFDAYSHQTFS